MTQQDGETVVQFIARLRKQTHNCNFNDQDVDIRDKVIDRCRSSVLRRKLLGYVQEGHSVRDKCCPARQAECSKCKMVGHYAAVCKTKTRGGTANSLGSRKREAEVNKYLEEVVVDDTDDDNDDEALGLFTAEDSERKGHTLIQVSVMLD